jgi:cytochrome c oxidase subunit 4
MQSSAVEHQPSVTPPAHDAAADHGGHADHDATYLIVYILLVLFTIAELGATYVGALKIPLLVGFAAAKAALVVAFYMHLRWEKRYLPLVFAAPVVIGILVALALQQLVMR